MYGVVGAGNYFDPVHIGYWVSNDIYSFCLYDLSLPHLHPRSTRASRRTVQGQAH